LTETGVERIAAHLNDLTDYLCARLRGRDYQIVSSRATGEKSQIVCLRHHSGEWSPLALYAHLRKQNIVVAPRGARLRIAPHFYNTVEDIDALLKALP
jgi:selenocysteine lyase/cysteine desulfurase